MLNGIENIFVYIRTAAFCGKGVAFITCNDFQVCFVNRQMGLVCRVLYRGALVAAMGGDA